MDLEYQIKAKQINIKKNKYELYTRGKQYKNNIDIA